MSARDPIHVAIAAARAASAAHIAACKSLDESDDAAVRRCNQACDDDARANKALAEMQPTTSAGLIALVAFYAEDADGTDMAAEYLDRVLALLKVAAGDRQPIADETVPTGAGGRVGSQTKCAGSASDCEYWTRTSAKPAIMDQATAKSVLFILVVRIVLFIGHPLALAALARRLWNGGMVKPGFSTIAPNVASSVTLDRSGGLR